MKRLLQSQRLCKVWCVFTDRAVWQVRGTLTGKYGVLCRRPYCHGTAERQCKSFMCSSLHGTDENQHFKEPEALFSEVTLLRPSFKQEKWNRLRDSAIFNISQFQRWCLLSQRPGRPLSQSIACARSATMLPWAVALR